MKKLSLIFTSFFLLAFFSTTSLHANGGVTLNPSSGTIGSAGRSIDIIIDTDGKPSDALHVALKYDGELSYDSFENGDICDVDVAERGEPNDDIFIHCFIWGESYVGSDGVLASLKFVPTAEGQGTITMTEILVEGVSSAVTGPPGTYTTTMSLVEQEENTPAPTPTPTPTPRNPASSPTPLPQTSLLSTAGLSLGFVLLLFSLIINHEISLKRSNKMSPKLRD